MFAKSSWVRRNEGKPDKSKRKLANGKRLQQDHITGMRCRGLERKGARKQGWVGGVWPVLVEPPFSPSLPPLPLSLARTPLHLPPPGSLGRLHRAQVRALAQRARRSISATDARNWQTAPQENIPRSNLYLKTEATSSPMAEQGIKAQRRGKKKPRACPCEALACRVAQGLQKHSPISFFSSGSEIKGPSNVT